MDIFIYIFFKLYVPCNCQIAFILFLLQKRQCLPAETNKQSQNNTHRRILYNV